jgi:hypothetical protein
VDALAQTLLGRDALQQPEQLAPLGHAEPAQQIPLGVAADSLELGHEDLAVAGEVQGMNSTVSSAPPTLDETTLLEVVEESDHAAGRRTELVCHGLLAAAGVFGHGAQDADVGRGDPQRRHPLREPRGGMRADLGEQEARTQER